MANAVGCLSTRLVRSTTESPTVRGPNWHRRLRAQRKVARRHIETPDKVSLRLLLREKTLVRAPRIQTSRRKSRQKSSWRHTPYEEEQATSLVNYKTSSSSHYPGNGQNGWEDSAQQHHSFQQLPCPGCCARRGHDAQPQHGDVTQDRLGGYVAGRADG